MKELLLIMLIFILALALRWIYLSEVVDSPLLFYSGLDPQAYDLWAQRIANGDWLGHEVFYQSPLYPYLLGIFYAVFGRHLFWVYVAQILVGSADCFLIYGMGKRMFGNRVGLMAGIFSAIYKPFIFYDAVLLKTFLEVFLIDLCIYLLLIASEKKNRPALIFSGLVLGLGAWARDNFVILVFWFYPWLLFRLKKQGRPASSIYFLAGFLLILAVGGIRNYAVGHDFVLTTSQGGQNFYIGNHLKNLTGTYIPPDFVTANPMFEQSDFRNEAVRRTGRRDLKPSQVSNFWFKESFREMRMDQRLFGERLLLKLGLFWNRREIADNVSYYLMKKEFSFLLRMPLLEFGLMAPFGLLGLALALKKRKALLAAGYVIIYWLSVSSFFIFARYRLAVVGPLLGFAGFGLDNLYLWTRERKWKSLAGGVVLIGVFTALVYAPLIKEHLDYAYYNLGNAYARAGKFKDADKSYRQAIAINPNPAEFWVNLGFADDKTGDTLESYRAFSEAARRDPEDAKARLGLGIALFKMRDFKNAQIELEKALSLNPGLEDAKIYLEMAKSKP